MSRSGSRSVSSTVSMDWMVDVSALWFREEAYAAHRCGPIHALTSCVPRRWVAMEDESEGERSGSGGDPVGVSVFSGAMDGSIVEWGWKTNGERAELVPHRRAEVHVEGVNALISIEDRYVASGSRDGLVRLLPCANLSRFPDDGLVWSGHTDIVRALAYAPHDARLYSGGFDRRIIQWDVTNGTQNMEWKLDDTREREQSMIGTRESVYSLCCSPDGHVVLAGHPSHHIECFDPRLSSPVATLRGHHGNIRSLLHDGAYTVFSGSSDRSIRMWDMRTHRVMHQYSLHLDSVWALCFGRTPLEVISAGRDGRCYLIDCESHSTFCLVQRPDPLHAISFFESPPNTTCHLFIGSTDPCLYEYRFCPPPIESSALGGNPVDLVSSSSKSETPGSISSSSASIGRRHSFLSSRVALVPPLLSEPYNTGRASVSVKRCKMLRDEQTILVQLSDASLYLFELLSGRTKPITFDIVSEDKAHEALRSDDVFEHIAMEFQPFRYSTSWITCRCSNGFLRLVLSEKEWFKRLIPADTLSEFSLAETRPSSTDSDLNYPVGVVFARSVLRNWLLKSPKLIEEFLKRSPPKSGELYVAECPVLQISDFLDNSSQGAVYFSVFHETESRALSRYTLSNLHEDVTDAYVPLWILDSFVLGPLSSDVQIRFQLVPALSGGRSTSGTFRLHSHPISRMDQIASFLRTKLDVSNDCDIRLSVLDKIISDYSMDVGTLYHLIWLSLPLSDRKSELQAVGCENQETMIIRYIAGS